MSWVDYEDEYFNEAYEEMEKCLLSYNEAKEGVFKDNWYFRDHLQIPHIKNILQKENNRDKILQFVAKFLDDHHRELSTSGPTYMFTFGDKETSFLYEIFGVNKDIILKMYNEMVNDTYYGSISKFFTGWINNAPHKILIVSMLIDAIQNNYQEIIECCEYLLAFSEYPILFSSYWRIAVKADVMEYTIEHLGNKFKIKECKDLESFLKYDAHKSVETHKERLRSGMDNEYMDLIYRVRTQMNSKFRNISNAYYDNVEANNTIHNKSSMFDDGSLADQEGSNTNISQIIDNTVSKFSTGSINVPLVGIAADGNKVDKGNLLGFLNQITSTKNNRMNKLVENIITVYFTKNPTNSSLTSSEFVTFGLSLYRSIGTSKDPLLAEMKSILEYWMDDIINISQYYNRPGTKINYTRAIFNYIILMINYYN